MKNKLLSGFVLVAFGVAFIFASYKFAPLAYAAPERHVNSSGVSNGATVLEFCYGLPAVVLIVIGVAAVVGGVVVAALTLFLEERK